MSKERKKLNISKFLNKRNVMSSVSAITLLILVITASLAWFVLQRTARIKEFGSDVSEWDFVLSVKSMNDGGKPLENDDEIDILYYSIKTNEIGDGKLAPGSSGKLKLYVSTTQDVVTKYVLSIDKRELKVELGSESTQFTSEELTEILHRHIKFYKDEECKKEITMENVLDGEIKHDQNEEIPEEEIYVYWVWHYDGEFLFNDEMIYEKQAMIDKYQIPTNDATELEKALLNKYDEEDVLISEYREKIEGNIRIEVAGTQKEPQQP